MARRTRTKAGARVARDVPTSMPLLEVRDLTVEFATRRGTVRAIEHVNVAVDKGETLGIVVRIRFGQIGHVLRGHAHPRSRRPDCSRLRAILRRRSHHRA